jgi:hypothetical protein
MGQKSSHMRKKSLGDSGSGPRVQVRQRLSYPRPLPSHTTNQSGSLDLIPTFCVRTRTTGPKESRSRDLSTPTALKQAV